MNVGLTIFSQVLDFIPRYQLNRCIKRYRGNYRARTFFCYDQLVCMMFAQLTYRDSLRDIEICLRAMRPKLYHAGLRGNISRSTLADANELRDWRIWADLAAVLIAMARPLYADEPLAVDLDQTVYAFDSTTIDLCLSLFPWARFCRTKGAVKLHTLVDLRGNIPCFVHVSDGKMADPTAMDLVPIEPGSFYIWDRGYNDFERLYRFTQELAFFVIRAKCNLVFSRRLSRPVDKSTGLRSDQTIVLCGKDTITTYPMPLRRVGFYAADLDKHFVFLTNNFSLPALMIAQLYKCRWQVELFFKWIKGHLRIKTFFGTSENAVKTQVWIAVCTYVLVAIIRKDLNMKQSMHEILQVLSLSLFEKKPILQAFSDDPLTKEDDSIHNQLSLFNF
jgi:hypothetical protein